MFKSLTKKQESLSLGARGEKAATEYLKSNGYKILDANFFNTCGRRLGEIDIIAKDKDTIVFVEVKTRTQSASGKSILPEESITRKKLYKMSKAAVIYIRKANLQDTPYRFDAITLVHDPAKNHTSLRHLKSIFF